MRVMPVFLTPFIWFNRVAIYRW